MSIRRVLVVGAGVAGSTLAYFMGRRGIETTVVERSTGQRSSGNPVDVRGLAWEVVEQMNLLTALRAAATRATTLAIVDDYGRRIGWIPTQTTHNALEIPRCDLVAILTEATREHAEFRYDDTVVDLDGDGDGVEVTFDRAPAQRFDLVVGADGLHSRVRRLAFGPESQFVTHLGLYIATVDLNRQAPDRHTVYMLNAPGRLVAVHPTTGREGGAFIFRHPPRPGLPEQDAQHHKELVAKTYAGMGWRVPELLQQLDDSEDMYFDAVSRVRLNKWSRGRTTLVGDAAGCVSLLGEGSSMAIVGAATLAQAIAASPTAPAEALNRYESAHRRRLLRRHHGVSPSAHLLVPATRAGVAIRNMMFRLWPLVDAARRRDHMPV